MDYRKCPHCGAQIRPLASACEFCGSELSDQKSGILEEFEQNYKSTNDFGKKVELINSLIVPSTKSDLLDLFFLAASNVNVIHRGGLFDPQAKLDKVIEDAWKSKFEQTYMKALLILKDDPEMTHVERIYKEKKKAMRWRLF